MLTCRTPPITYYFFNVCEERTATLHFCQCQYLGEATPMRLKALPVVAVFLSILMLSWGLSPRTHVSAERLLQNAPHLDGMKIYFSEANGEASRFDRSDTGISRLAGLLRQLGARLYTVDWRSRLPSDA